MELIKGIDKYYKNQTKKMHYIVDDNYNIKFDKKNMEIMYFINNNKLKYTVKYNFYGIINKDMKFIWSDTIYGFNNENTKELIKDIKKNNKMFKNINNFYYKLLTNNTINITSEKEIEKINKLLLYLNKDKFIINPMNSNNYIQFIGVNKIMEKYV